MTDYRLTAHATYRLRAWLRAIERTDRRLIDAAIILDIEARLNGDKLNYEMHGLYTRDGLGHTFTVLPAHQLAGNAEEPACVRVWAETLDGDGVLDLGFLPFADLDDVFHAAALELAACGHMDEPMRVDVYEVKGDGRATRVVVCPVHDCHTED